MSRLSSHHSTIVLARTFDVAIERLFAAIADPGERRQVWAAGDEMTLILDEADLHVGGRDVYRFGRANAPRFRGQSIYHDIVPACRIVSTDMVWEGTSRLLSVALTTLELASPGHGTRLKITSQLVWLDDGDRGGDDFERRRPRRQRHDQRYGGRQLHRRPRSGQQSRHHQYR